MIHALAVAGTCLLALLTAACLAILLIAVTTPANPEVTGDVPARRAGIIMTSALTAVLGTFLVLALINL